MIHKLIIFCLFLVCGSLTLTPAFSQEDPSVPPLQITIEDHGWLCTQTAVLDKYGTRENYIYLVSSHLAGDEILLFCENFYYPGSSMGFRFNWNQLHAYRITDAQPVFSRFIYYQEHRVQIDDIFTWGDRCILFGYYQIAGEKIGDTPVRHYLIYVLDDSGNILQQKLFPVDTENRIYPLGVHQEKNLLVCGMTVNRGPLLTRFITYSLPNLQVVDEIELEKKTYNRNVAYDGGDWYYVLFQEEVGDNSRGIIEKKNLFTSETLWIRNMGSSFGYQTDLNIQNNLLRYGIVDAQMNYDGGSLELDTGKPVETADQYDPNANVIMVESRGKFLKISLADSYTSFFVDLIPLQSVIFQNKWESLK